MKKNLITTLLASGLFICSAGAQTTFTSESGYTLTVPEGWSSEQFESGETEFMSKNADGDAIYTVNLKKLEEGKTAKDHLLWLESYMPDAGFSENTMPEESRHITGTDAAPYGAEEVFGGAYKKTAKNGIEMFQIIFVYRKGVYAYMTIQTCPLADVETYQPFFNIFLESFKLTE